VYAVSPIPVSSSSVAGALARIGSAPPLHANTADFHDAPLGTSSASAGRELPAAMTDPSSSLPMVHLERKILMLRGERVMLDADLATLCGVPPFAVAPHRAKLNTRYSSAKVML
jgi:hypothetical protein